MDSIEKMANKLRGTQSFHIEIMLREYVNKIIDECANRACLTDFASEFLQEGSGEAIDKDSILNIKKEI